MTDELDRRRRTTRGRNVEVTVSVVDEGLTSRYLHVADKVVGAF